MNREVHLDEICERVRERLDWPKQYFRRIRTVTLPNGERVVVIRVVVGLGSVDFHWRVFREEGRWLLSYADDRPAIPVPAEAEESLDLVADRMDGVLKRTIAKQVWR